MVVSQYNGLSDSDAFENVAWKVLGDERMKELRRRTDGFPKEVANDKLVDEVFRILNNPFVRLAMRLVK